MCERRISEGMRWFMQGATVVDFAYHVHTDVGNQMFGAKVNGKVVHAGHALANAEVVEVLTYDGRPSRGSIQRHQVWFYAMSLKK